MTSSRKTEHVKIALSQNINASHNYWDDIQLIHNALPEIDKDDIDLATKLFGKKLSAPIIISAITGGYPGGERINSHLAEAAENLGLGFGVGSQRPALDDPELEYTYTVVKNYQIPLVLANLGAPQLVGQRGKSPLGIEDAKRAMQMVNADLLAVHLNFLQEVVQPEGDQRAQGCLEAIRNLAAQLPVIVKETGAGISRKDLRLLTANTGIKGIDVGGMSGTSFAAVEYYRAQQRGDALRERLGKTFWDWGIPTPVAVLVARNIVNIPIIATGGLRNGLDCAKAIVCGASAAGFAGILLKPASESAQAVIRELEIIIEELKTAMFLMGAKDIRSLRARKFILSHRLRSWKMYIEGEAGD
jgi:isopentenyl-diphosphate delta-isomerase